MAAPIRRRLEALECADGAASQRPLLIITRYDGEPFGIEMPPPLPDVLSLPNESWDALVARAAARVPGGMPALLLAKYADDGAAPCAH